MNFYILPAFLFLAMLSMVFFNEKLVFNSPMNRNGENPFVPMLSVRLYFLDMSCIWWGLLVTEEGL